MCRQTVPAFISDDDELAARLLGSSLPMTNTFDTVPWLRRPQRVIAVWAAAMTLAIGSAYAQDAQASTTPASPDNTSAADNRVSCVSQPGERQHCAADTSAGVVLVKSTGSVACLLGKTWGYDERASGSPTAAAASSWSEPPPRLGGSGDSSQTATRQPIR